MYSSKSNLYCYYFLWFSLLLFLSCHGISYPKPLNCGLYECPSYEVVHSQKEFEIRNYKDATWLSSPTIVSKSFNNATQQGSKKILGYISGGNNAGKRIEMTVPALVNVIPPTNLNNDTKFAVYFYLPQGVQKTPPGSDELQPSKLPAQKLVAVRRFGGFVNDSIVGPNSEVEVLRRSLKGTPYEGKFKSSTFSVAIYNAPIEVINRVNEVLLSFVE